MVINKKIRSAVDICHEEGENDINGKEAIDNIVNDEECVRHVLQKPKFEWAEPGRIYDKKDQKQLPGPVSWIERRNYESPKFGCLVDSRTQRWQQIAGEAVAAALHSEFVIAEPLQVEFSAGKRHDLLVRCSLFLPTATINLKTV